METLAHQRCLNHELREAVVRCPECRQFFCRECVVEHEDRMICAGCLAKLAKAPLWSRARLSGLVRAGQMLLGLFCAWLFFYWLGQALLSLDAKIHEGTIWKGGFWDDV